MWILQIINRRLHHVNIVFKQTNRSIAVTTENSSDLASFFIMIDW